MKLQWQVNNNEDHSMTVLLFYAPRLPVSISKSEQGSIRHPRSIVCIRQSKTTIEGLRDAGSTSLAHLVVACLSVRNSTIVNEEDFTGRYSRPTAPL